MNPLRKRLERLERDEKLLLDRQTDEITGFWRANSTPFLRTSAHASQLTRKRDEITLTWRVLDRFGVTPGLAG